MESGIYILWSLQYLWGYSLFKFLFFHWKFHTPLFRYSHSYALPYSAAAARAVVHTHVGSLSKITLLILVTWKEMQNMLKRHFPTQWFSDNLHQSRQAEIFQTASAFWRWIYQITWPQLQPILHLLSCPRFSVAFSTRLSSTMATASL